MCVLASLGVKYANPHLLLRNYIFLTVLVEADEISASENSPVKLIKAGILRTLCINFVSDYTSTFATLINQILIVSQSLAQFGA